MEDEQIVDLYWQREEAAISETKKKYSHYLTKIAYNILANFEDSEEVVNDIYLKAWNSIPPHKPQLLSTYLAKLARRLSIDVYRKKSSQKRGGTEYDLSLSELEICVSGKDNPEQEMELQQLGEAISTYLHSLPEENRNVFVCRYFFCDSIQEIAAYIHGSEPKVKSMLYRIRLGLRAYLEKEGYVL